jgi:endogenous inhibitor of DNA gyrase (YacG/DUF329 family)
MGDPELMSGNPGNREDQPRPAAQQCPICGKPSTPETSPFCSKRCRDVDLNRWLSGRYVIPGRSAQEDGDDSDR